MPDLHHVALRVNEPERSAKFYRDLLELPEIRRFPDEGGAVRSIWLRAGSAVLMLEKEVKGAGPDQGSGHVLAFRVEALAPWEARVRAAGITVSARTEYTLFFQDPDGHRVGLSVYQIA